MKNILYLISAVLLLSTHQLKAQCAPPNATEFTGTMFPGGVYKISSNQYAQQLPKDIPSGVTLYVTRSARIDIPINTSQATKVQVCDGGGLSVAKGGTNKNLIVGPYGAVKVNDFLTDSSYSPPQLKENAVVALCGYTDPTNLKGKKLATYTGPPGGKSYFIVGETYAYNTNQSRVEGAILIDYGTYHHEGARPVSVPQNTFQCIQTGSIRYKSQISESTRCQDSFNSADNPFYDNSANYKTNVRNICDLNYLINHIPGYFPSTAPTPTPAPAPAPAPAPTSAIQVSVFEDTDGNPKTVEQPLQGVTITLYNSSSSSSPIRGTTAPNGVVTFPNLPAGTYTVEETDLSGYESVSDSQGNLTDNRVQITLGPGQTEYAEFVDRKLLSAIQVSVFEDTDGNPKTVEQPLQGVTITLYNSSISSSPIRGTTAPNGVVTFPNLPAGTYTVVETDLSGYESVWDSQGNLTDNRVQINLGPGQTEYAQFVDRKLLSAIQVSVFEDTDGNPKTVEQPLQGVTITLYNSSSSSSPIRGTTAPNGVVTFPNLPAGTYTVEETDLSGYESVSDSQGNLTDNRVQINLGPGQIENAQFVDRKLLSAIQVSVFEDTDGNPKTVEQPLQGVTITLYNSSSSSSPIRGTTAPNGVVTFPNLPAGNYTVEETDLSGYESVSDSQGNLTDNRVQINLGPGQTEYAEFVDRELSAIQVSVSEDTNGDTIGDQALQGVTITLYNSSSSSSPIRGTTAPNGVVTFPNLPAGTYTVEETDLSGYESVSDSQGNLTDNRVQINLGPGQTEYAEFVDRELSAIQVSVSEDTNGDTIGDQALQGVTISLYGSSSSSPIRGTTNTRGIATFPNLPAGNYTVVETNLSGYESVWDSQGNLTDNRVQITLGPGQTAPAQFVDRSNKLVCNPVGATGTGETFPSALGISTLDRGNDTSWLESMKNGQLILDSKEKGLVIPRIANPNAIRNPSDGMIFFDTTEQCIKLYQNNKWGCLNTQECIKIN